MRKNFGQRGARHEPRPDKWMCKYCGTWMKPEHISTHSKEFGSTHPDVYYMTYESYIRNQERR